MIRRQQLLYTYLKAWIPIHACLFFFVICASCVTYSTITIIIDPLGDTAGGRIVDDMFERSVTMSLAQAIQQRLHVIAPAVKIIIARKHGEVREPYGAVQYANIIHANLLLVIGFYQHQSDIPTVMIGRYAGRYDAIPFISGLGFIPVEESYRYVRALTIQMLEKTHAVLKTYSCIECFGPYAFPCVPLLGSIVPALYYECGINTSNEWRIIVEPLCAALEQLVLAL